ncbi:hypothetical protein APHAL10511_008611 [Amanita phalloides]|nr:hypothetical protein APHAL10511_008611 [Amanita phalloides]
MMRAAGVERAKLSVAPKFPNADAIRAALRTENPDALIQGLTTLRNQLSVKHTEPPIRPQDDRLLLIQQWLGDRSGVKDLFNIWENAASKDTSLNALLVSLLSAVLSLSSTHVTYHAIGHNLLEMLLNPLCIRRLNSYIGGSSNDQILMSLKVYNNMSTFAGGRERKTVLDSFPWELKSLPKLFNMRLPILREKSTHINADIRTLYITLLLSFIQQDSSSHVKTVFLEQHRETFMAVFKGLPYDHYTLIRKVLEACWTLWSDPKVKRTLKIGLFGEATIGYVLLKIYERTKLEDDDPEHVPADLVHHFLLAICSRPGVGICFKDRGWYAREQDTDEEMIQDDLDSAPQKRSKIYNKILSNVLKLLKINEDPRQQELAIRIMAACPELVAGYWSAAALTLEPRLSSTWLTNVAFFGTIVSFPVPTSSFQLGKDPRTDSYHPTPPPLYTILGNVFPSVNTKSNFSKGLQSTAGLVQHCSALALTKCLMKYDQILHTFREITAVLEEDSEEGQWYKRIRDLEKEVRRRVPEFQVVVAFSQHASAVPDTTAASKTNASQPALNATRTALLAESAQRLLWMYHRCLPALVAEARFDVGKLLQGFSSVASDEDEEQSLEAVKRLERIRRLHVIRLLRESDQFSWTGKLPGSSSHTYIHVLLTSFARENSAAERAALDDLLQRLLSQTILFQEDADEPSLWLSALPKTCRSSGSVSPDGVLLTDEADSVITFLDECVQRCLKTPYRYIEELQALVKNPSSATPTADFAFYPSPLLVTVIEQLNAKMSNKLLSPSDVLALASFIRKLVVNLSMKLSNLSLLWSVTERMDVILSKDRLFPNYPVMTAAVRRQVGALRSSLTRLAPDDLERMDHSLSVSEEVADFLRQVAQMSAPSSPTARAYAAYELVDWLRLVEDPIGLDEVNCVVDVVKDFYPPALSVVVDNLDPVEHSIWEAIDVEQYLVEFSASFSFHMLYLHADKSVFLDEEPRRMICRSLTNSPGLLSVKRAIRLVFHGLNPTSSRDELHSALLLLLTNIMEDVSLVLSAPDVDMLKEEMFARDGNLKSLCITPDIADSTRDALKRLVRVSLHPLDARNKTIVSDISAYWLSMAKCSVDDGHTKLPLVAIWISHFPVPELLGLLDDFGRSVQEMPLQSHVDILNAVISALEENAASDANIGIQLSKRLPLLFTLLEIFQDREALENLIAATLTDALLLYSGSWPPMDDGGHTRSLSSMIQVFGRQWLRVSESFPSDNVARMLLGQEIWTKSTVKILCVLAYERNIPQDTFTTWIKAGQCAKRLIEEYLPVLTAFLDRLYVDREEISASDSDGFVDLFKPLVQTVMNENAHPHYRSMASTCAALMMELIPPGLLGLISHVVEKVESLDVQSLTPDLLSLVLLSHRKSPTAAMRLVVTSVEHGMQWLVRQLSDDDPLSDAVKTIIKLLSSLVKIAKGVKGQYLETLLSVAVQASLKDPEIVRLTTFALLCAHLKPLIVNRHLQSILQHPQFHKLCAIGGHDGTRDVIVHMICALFHLYPSNTCQVTHVEPLIDIYGGTLSPPDLKLFSIFQLFEDERKLSAAALFSRWSANKSPSSNFLDAVHNLDPGAVMRTCLHFPKWRKLEDQSTRSVDKHDAQLYDPVFLMLMFGAMLSENPPSSAFAWVKMFRTNIVGLLIRSLSCKDNRLREIALCHLSALWKLLQVADMIEKPHVMYILGLLKDTFAHPSDDPPQRLPTYTTLLLLHSLRGVFYPSNFIYPMTARFLLQRPELDTKDVPMLYVMLYSSSDNWKKERGWIIRMLADGMVSSDDWRILKRRHTWDLLASLFQSSYYGDHSLHRSILEVLANLSCNGQATRSLILKSSLLTWIQMQIHATSNKEDIAWAKILANIVFLHDAKKLEAGSNGEWRKIICRCLSILLDLNRCSDANAPILLSIISPTIVKLNSAPSALASNELAKLVDKALESLATFETKIMVRSGTQVDLHGTGLMLPPFTASRLYDAEEQCEPFLLEYIDYQTFDVEINFRGTSK